MTGYAASVSEFAGAEGRFSSMVDALPDIAYQRGGELMQSLYRFAGQEVAHGSTAMHFGPSVHAEPEHKADHSYEHDNNKRINLGIAIARLMGAKDPESYSTETWTDLGDLARAMAIKARRTLVERGGPRPTGRRLTNGDGS